MEIGGLNLSSWPFILRLSQRRSRELLCYTLQWWLMRNNSCLFSLLSLKLALILYELPFSYFHNDRTTTACVQVSTTLSFEVSDMVLSSQLSTLVSFLPSKLPLCFSSTVTIVTWFPQPSISEQVLALTVDSSGSDLSRSSEETQLRSKAMTLLQESKPVLGSAQQRLSSISIRPCG